MDLRAYYRKMREIEASIAEEFPVIKSVATEDGGNAGQLAEVTRAIAARMVNDGIAELASVDEVREFRRRAEEARAREEQRRRAAEIQFAILSEADFRTLQGAARPKATAQQDNESRGKVRKD
jgi:hypothetical protein